MQAPASSLFVANRETIKCGINSRTEAPEARPESVLESQPTETNPRPHPGEDYNRSHKYLNARRDHFEPRNKAGRMRSESRRSRFMRPVLMPHAISPYVFFSYFLKPAVSMPRCASGFFMNVSHTNPVRAFSAISIVMPVSMPTTSVSYQLVRGLNASTNP